MNETGVILKCFITAPDEIAPRHNFRLSGWAGCESCEVTSLAPFPLTQFTGAKPINIPNIWCQLRALCSEPPYLCSYGMRCGIFMLWRHPMLSLDMLHDKPQNPVSTLWHWFSDHLFTHWSLRVSCFTIKMP